MPSSSAGRPEVAPAEGGRRRRLVILGRQGAGKGTQGERLAQHYGIPKVSTGDIFRAAVKQGTDAGERAREYMDAGELVPDEVVVAVVGERLAEPDAEKAGFLLDGFPRNLVQAEALDGMLGGGGPDLVVELQVPTEMVLRRLAGRRVCVDCGTNYSVGRPPAEDWTCDRCGGKVVQRQDDTEAAISRRLALYEKETEPLLARYLTLDRLVAVDGVGNPDTVTARLLGAIDDRLGGEAGSCDGGPRC